MTLAKAPTPFRRRAAGEEIQSLDLFASGKFRGKRYTVGDLEEMVRNFRELGPVGLKLLDPPCVLGHEENQEYLDRSDLPSAGWVDRVWLEKYQGPDQQLEATLKGSVSGIPPKIAQMIRDGRFRKVSAEVYDDFQDDYGKFHGKALRRLAFLGAEVPQVKRIGDLPIPTPQTNFCERFGNRPRCLKPEYAMPVAARGTFLCFAEIAVMDRAKMIAAIQAAMPGIQQATLDAMSDDALADLSKNLPAPGGASAGQSAAAAGGGPVMTMGDPATMSKEEMIAELVAAGENPDELAAMTEDDLRGIYAEMGLGGEGAGAAPAGGGAAPMGDGKRCMKMDDGSTPAPAGEGMPSKEEMIAELTAMGEDPAALETMDEASLAAMYAELTGGGAPAPTTQAPAVTMSERQKKEAGVITRLTSRAVRDSIIARNNKITQFAETLVKTHRILPRQKPQVIKHLRKCKDEGSVRFTTFSEGKAKLNYGTELESTMAEYMGYAPIARFAEEKLGNGNGDSGSDTSRELRAVRNYATRHFEILKNAGYKSVDQFVQKFAEAHKADPNHTCAAIGIDYELYS